MKGTDFFIVERIAAENYATAEKRDGVYDYFNNAPALYVPGIMVTAHYTTADAIRRAVEKRGFSCVYEKKTWPEVAMLFYTRATAAAADLYENYMIPAVEKCAAFMHENRDMDARELNNALKAIMDAHGAAYMDAMKSAAAAD